MSVGAFIGIRASFADASTARLFLEAIDDALREAALPPYVEPDAKLGRKRRPGLGRSSLDQESAGTLVQLARRADDSGDARHLQVIAENPYRVAFLPMELAVPIATRYVERIAGRPAVVWIASAPALRRALFAVAPALGIPVLGETVSDEIATVINAGESMDDDDYGAVFEAERSAWLMLVEGTDIALAERSALSLAG